MICNIILLLVCIPSWYPTELSSETLWMNKIIRITSTDMVFYSHISMQLFHLVDPVLWIPVWDNKHIVIICSPPPPPPLTQVLTQNNPIFDHTNMSHNHLKTNANAWLTQIAMTNMQRCVLTTLSFHPNYLVLWLDLWVDILNTT
jgi:hypothetical protein